MTNPGGMAPPSVRHTSVAPLFPRHHLQPDDDPKRTRDVQVWPRAMRETHERQDLHRTAAVKHHLRAMAGRTDMLTTYEHDFAMMSRPNAKGRSTSFGASFYGENGKPGTYHRDMMRTNSTEYNSSRISAPKAWHDDDSNDNRSIRSAKLGSRDRDLAGSLGPSSMQKMQAMKSGDDPMRLTVNGWGDQRWNPKTHPAMIQGMSAKRNNLVTTANLMNLRAPDLPFSTR